MLLPVHERLLISSPWGWRLGKGGHDHAEQQQRPQPDRQLVGRNEFDDGSGSNRTGPCVAIRLVTQRHPAKTVLVISLGPSLHQAGRGAFQNK